MAVDAWRRPDGHQSVGTSPERKPCSAPLLEAKVGLRPVAPRLQQPIGVTTDGAAPPRDPPLQGPDYGVRAASRMSVRAFMTGLSLMGKRERPDEVDEGGPISMRQVLQEERAAKKEAARTQQRHDARLLRSRMGALALVLFASTVLSLVASELSPAQAYTIPTGSMEPVLPKGSLLTVGPGDVEVGSIIVFTDPGGQEVAHRVIALVETDHGPRIRTQGDANNAADSFLVKHDDVVGVYWKHIPYAGYLWLMPIWLQATLFFGFTLAYSAIALSDAGRRLRIDRQKLVALSLVFIVFIPGAFGGVIATQAESQATFDVLSEGMNPLLLSAGDMGETTVANQGNSAETMLGEQKLWKEIQMLHCGPADSITTKACSVSSTSATYMFSTGSLFRLGNEYDPAPTFYLEATMRVQGGATAAYAILYDHAAGTEVAGSEVSTTAADYTVVRSEPFSLTLNQDYKFALKRDGSSGSAQATSVKLVMSQPFEENAERRTTSTYIRTSVGDETTTSSSTSWTSMAKDTHWTYDDERYDGVGNARFRVTAQQSTGATGTDGQVRLLANGTPIANITVPKNEDTATYSQSFTLRPGATYTVQYRAMTSTSALIGHTLTLHNSYIQVRQEAFTKTERVIDLANPFSFETAANATVGYTGRYHADSEWGNATAELQLHASLDLAYVQLYADPTGVDTQKVSMHVEEGSDVMTSDPFTLLDGNVTYGLQVGAPEGGGTVYAARFVIPQEFGKTYYSVIETTPDATQCTWDYSLLVVDHTDLGNIEGLEIRINDTDGEAVQITTSGQSVTKSTGTPISVSDGQSLGITAYYRPSDTSGGLLNADLYATCQGIHVKQPIGFATHGWDSESLDEFTFDPIGSQTAGTPFSVTVQARNRLGEILTSYSSTAQLTVDSGTVSPSTVDFTNGEATIDVNITTAGTPTLTMTDTGAGSGGTGATGASNVFEVTPDVLDHILIFAGNEDVTDQERTLDSCDSTQGAYLMQTHDRWGNVIGSPDGNWSQQAGASAYWSFSPASNSSETEATREDGPSDAHWLRASYGGKTADTWIITTGIMPC